MGISSKFAPLLQELSVPDPRASHVSPSYMEHFPDLRAHVLRCFSLGGTLSGCQYVCPTDTIRVIIFFSFLVEVVVGFRVYFEGGDKIFFGGWMQDMIKSKG